MKYRIKSWEELCEIGSCGAFGAIISPDGLSSFVGSMRRLCGVEIDNLGLQIFGNNQRYWIAEWMVNEIDGICGEISINGGDYCGGIEYSSSTTSIQFSDPFPLSSSIENFTTSVEFAREYLGEWKPSGGVIFGSNLITNKTEEENMYSEKGLVRGAKLNGGSVFITEELVDVIKIRQSDREVFLKDGSVISNVVSLRMANDSMLTGWEGSDPTVKTTDTREEFCNRYGELEELSARLNCGLISEEEYPKRRDEIEIKYKDVSPKVKHELVW